VALNDYLTEGQIWLDFTAGSKAEALAALSRLAAEARGLSPAEVLEVLAAREALGSTGVGGGVALPHGRLPGLTSPVVGLALAPGGVEFDSLDGRPVR
jgi:mannitol/fructose-specific phosphotransferase system IIA component (Ntr-type)